MMDTRNASDLPSPLSLMLEVLDPDRRLPNLSRASTINPVSTPTMAVVKEPLPSSSSSITVELEACISRCIIFRLKLSSKEQKDGAT